MQFTAVKYRYADNVAYRPNLYVLKTSKEKFRSWGGLIVLKDKAFAFVGHSGLVQDKIDRIIKSADSFAWGATPAEALAKIKPELEKAVTDDR